MHVGENFGADHGGKHAADASFFALFENELVAEATDATKEESEAGAHCRKNKAKFILNQKGEEGVTQGEKGKKGEPEDGLFGC